MMSILKTPDVMPWRPLSWPLYLLAFMMFCVPLLEAAVAVGSFHPSAVVWRFGAVGMFSSGLLTPVTGLVLAATIAYLLQHRRALLALTVVAGLAALAMLCVMGLFTLDALQVRNEIAVPARRAYILSTGKALVFQGLTLLTLLALAISGQRILRATTRQPRPSEAAKPVLGAAVGAT